MRKCLLKYMVSVTIVTKTPDRARFRTAESVVNMVEKASNPKNNEIANAVPVAAPIWL